ncbi:MAG: 2Fe-2S iron-sulfur cluster-binding protein [Pseudomonadota bacterium]
MPQSTRHLIKVLPDKKAFYCEPDQKVLDAGLGAGLPLPHSCRGGNCGRCAAKVLVGDYRYDRTTPPPGITAEQRASGYALLCQIVPNGPLTLETATSEPVGTSRAVRLPCRIVRRELVATDVMKLTLQLPRTQPMDFKPGQYLDVLLDRGLRRSYSLASLPYSLSTEQATTGDRASRAAASLELHVRRVPGGAFSDVAFDQSEQGSLLRVEGPFGAFGWR